MDQYEPRPDEIWRTVDPDGTPLDEDAARERHGNPRGPY
jgi:hypothetical protein